MINKTTSIFLFWPTLTFFGNDVKVIIIYND